MDRSRKEAEHRLAALAAWGRVCPGHPDVENTTVLKLKGKSSVFRFAGAGPDGQTVVAKLCHNSTAHVEQTVYEEILPRVPYRTLGFFGAQPMPGTDRTWLFTEDAEGVPYSKSDPVHRSLAAEWLATLHGTTQDLEDRVSLPGRGAEYYRGLLEKAKAALQNAWEAPPPGREPRGILENLLEATLAVDKNLSGLDEECADLPNVFTHNGFYGKNAQVAERNGERVVLAFDWESAGWGLPALDIAREDVAAYGNALRRFFPDIEDGRLKRISLLGKTFWVLKAVEGEKTLLSLPWSEKFSGKLAAYRDQLADGVSALGWTRA